MPDVREVYDMVTHQKSPDPGALERQQTKQVRSARTKRFGALAVAAVIGIAAIVVFIVMRNDQTAPTPASEGTTVNTDAAAVNVAQDFLAAFTAFDAQKAMTYVADGANLSQLIDGQLSPDAEGMSLFLRFSEAMGYGQKVTSCETTGADSDTIVQCAIDFDALRSDEIGRGPYAGMFTIRVREGKIVQAAISWNTHKFSPQVWQPFADWMSENHPKDFEAMYIDGGSNYRITEESIQLWEQRTREYVEDVKLGTA